MVHVAVSRNGSGHRRARYVGESDEDMLNRRSASSTARESVGIPASAPRYYKPLLMGQNGSRQALVDSTAQRKWGRLGGVPSRAGKRSS